LVATLLARLLPHGRIITECPVSTSEGVKGIDVAWISKERRQPQRTQICFTVAPEICVEIKSPRNSARELEEKKALYFAAGAEEVWICAEDGAVKFFGKAEPGVELARSARCGEFPRRLPLDE
jgi:Uma2 family endonuclease